MNVIKVASICVLLGILPHISTFGLIPVNIVHSMAQLNAKSGQRGQLFPHTARMRAPKDINAPRHFSGRQQSTELQAFLDIKLLLGLGALLVAGSAAMSSEKEDASVMDAEKESPLANPNPSISSEDPKIQNEQEALKKSLAEEAEKLKEAEIAKVAEAKRVKEAEMQAALDKATKQKLLDEAESKKKKEEDELKAKRAEEERERIRLQKEKQMEMEKAEREKAELKAKEEAKAKADFLEAEKLKHAQKEAEEARRVRAIKEAEQEQANMTAYRKKLEQTKEEAKAKAAAIANEAKVKAAAESEARAKTATEAQERAKMAAESEAKAKAEIEKQMAVKKEEEAKKAADIEAKAVEEAEAKAAEEAKAKAAEVRAAEEAKVAETAESKKKQDIAAALAKEAATSDRAKVRESKKRAASPPTKSTKKELNNTYEKFFEDMTISASQVEGTNAKKIDDVIALYAKCPLPKLRSILDKYGKEGVEKPGKDATVDLLVRASMASVWYSTAEWTSFLEISEKELAEQARETTLFMRGAITAGNELSEARIKQLIREVGGPKAMPRKKRGSEVKLTKSDYLATLLEILKNENENDFQRVAEALNREAGKKGLSKKTTGKTAKSTSTLASDKRGFGK